MGYNSVAVSTGLSPFVLRYATVAFQNRAITRNSDKICFKAVQGHPRSERHVLIVKTRASLASRV